MQNKLQIQSQNFLKEKVGEHMHTHTRTHTQRHAHTQTHIKQFFMKLLKESKCYSFIQEGTFMLSTMALYQAMNLVKCCKDRMLQECLNMKNSVLKMKLIGSHYQGCSEHSMVTAINLPSPLLPFHYFWV